MFHRVIFSGWILVDTFPCIPLCSIAVNFISEPIYIISATAPCLDTSSEAYNHQNTQRRISREHCCVDFYWITWHYKNYTGFLLPSSLGNVSGTIKLYSNNSSSSFILLLFSLQQPLLSAIIVFNGEFLVYYKCYSLPIWGTLPLCLNSMFEQEFNAVERGEIKDIWPAQYPVPRVNGAVAV